MINFQRVIEEIIDDVKNGKMKPIEMVKIFAYFSYFIEKKSNRLRYKNYRKCIFKWNEHCIM